MNICMHTKESLKMICVNPDCKAQPTVCRECLYREHRSHSLDLYSIDQLIAQVNHQNNYFIQQSYITLKSLLLDIVMKIDENISKLIPYGLQFNKMGIDEINQICSIMRENQQDQNKHYEFFTQVFQTLQIEFKEIDKSLNNSQAARQLHQKGWEQYQKYQNYREAISYFNQTLQIDPNNIDSHFDKGYCLYKLNNSYEAEDCFKRVIQLDENHGHAKYFLSLYSQMKQKQR